ncbi:MAG TPA: hypothetical protein VGF15_03425 [Solirubrobacteraceae bacterium]|jgi:hypothetical protein
MLVAAQTFRKMLTDPFALLERDSDSENAGTTSRISVVRNDFLEFFEICRGTDDEAEEAWGYEQLKATYDRAIAGADDRAPSFFDAMAWAAQELARTGCASGR